jgi:putative solute:sodium symporter small subunit
MSNSPDSQMRDDVSDKAAENALAYWRANVGLIRIILFIWALVSLGMAVLFMPFFKDVTLPGFQINISFWFAHQGAIYIFVVLIFFYAWRMDKLDKDHKVGEEEQ